MQLLSRDYIDPLIQVRYTWQHLFAHTVNNLFETFGRDNIEVKIRRYCSHRLAARPGYFLQSYFL